MSEPRPARWELETADLRLVERRLAARPRGAAPSIVRTGPAHRARPVFLDTAGGRIFEAGYALRVRRLGQRARVELLPLSLDADGRRAFAEDMGSGAPRSVAHAPGAVGERVRLLARRAGLREVLAVHVRTSRFVLRDGADAIGHLTLEEISLPPAAARPRARIARVRIEAAPGTAAERLEPLVAEMRLAAGLREARESATLAALTAGGAAPRPAPDLGPTGIGPGSTLGETAFAVLRRQFAELLAKEPGTRLGDDAEDLHAMRVASRRLRAAMSLFRAALPRRAEKLREELAWVARALGLVRDIDVQDEQFAAWAERDPRLLAAALTRGRRAEARRHMLDVLDSARWRLLVRDFAAMLRSGPLRTNRASSALLVTAAPALVRERRRKVRRAVKALVPGAPPEAYHAARIRMKRLRYALEFLEDVYGEPARDLARRLAAVQDVLGRHQDACVAISRVENALVGDDSIPSAAAFAMGVVAERSAQEAARMRDEFPKVYARTRGRPWRRLKRTMERMRPGAIRTPLSTPLG